MFVPRKCMKSSHLLPAGAELDVRTTDKAANIRTDVSDAEIVEFHRVDYRSGQCFPVGAVVAQPMTGVASAGDERRTEHLIVSSHSLAYGYQLTAIRSFRAFRVLLLALPLPSRAIRSIRKGCGYCTIDTDYCSVSRACKASYHTIAHPIVNSYQT